MATSKEKLDQEELMLRCPFLKRRRRISFVHHWLGLGQLGRLERLAAQQGLHVGAWHHWSGNVSSYGKWPVGKMHDTIFNNRWPLCWSECGLDLAFFCSSCALLLSASAIKGGHQSTYSVRLGVVQTWSSLSSGRLIYYYSEFYFFPFVKLLTLPSGHLKPGVIWIDKFYNY